MSWLSRMFERFDPQPENHFGVGFLKPLPEDHPFQQAAVLHDWAYTAKGKEGMSRDEADADLFWRMALLAHNQQNPEKRCELMLDICRFWPMVKRFGWIFFEGGRK
jgi:hypothetical protein